VKIAYFLKINYHAGFQDPVLSGTIIIPTPRIIMAAVIVLLMMEIKKDKDRLAHRGIMFKPNLMKICLLV
jgi:hypothetical protein